MKKEERKRKRRLDNKGLSLVEVIIAVVILTLVVVPTLRMFSSSVSYNTKARKQQRAITVAESVMESFKAYSVEELCNQFSGGFSFKGVKGASAGFDGFVTAYDASGGVTPALDGGALNTQATSFVFFVRNAEVDNELFDIRVSVRKKDVQKVLYADKYNKSSDIIIQLDGNFENYVYNIIRDDVQTNVLPSIDRSTLTDIAADSNIVLKPETSSDRSIKIKNIKRTIKVNGADDTNVDLSVTYVYDGEVKINYNTTLGVDPVEATVTLPSKTLNLKLDKGTEEKAIVNATGGSETLRYSTTGEALENLYIYYYPMYDGCEVGAGLGGSTKDEILVNGNIPAGTNVHIAKQLYSSYSVADLNNNETRYDLSVTGNNNLKLWHNLEDTLPGCGSAPQAPNIYGFPSDDRKPLASKYEADGTVKPENEGYLNKDQALLYDVNVTVYNGGTSNMVATFAGTMND